MKKIAVGFIVAFCVACFAAEAEPVVELTEAVVFLPYEGENIAAVVFCEELQKRTGVELQTTRDWPGQGTVFVAEISKTPGMQPESYRLTAGPEGGRAVVRVTGADKRGMLFGVGRLLRMMDWRNGSAIVPLGLDVASAPAYAIRGHQLGYRHTANSYDAWTVAQSTSICANWPCSGATRSRTFRSRTTTAP
jgi:hypothetical protein